MAVPPEIDTQIRGQIDALASRHPNRKDLTQASAALLFFEYAQYPSAAVVRGYTGRGSLADIQRDLNEFWDGVRAKAKVRVAGVDLPQDLLDGFGASIAQLWELAKTKANEALDSLRREALDQVAEVERQVEAAREARERAELEAAGVREQLDKLNEAKAAVDQAMAAQGATLAATERQLVLCREELVRAANAHAEALVRAAHDLDAERSARAASEEVLAGEVRFAKLEIERAREQTRDYKAWAERAEGERQLSEQRSSVVIAELRSAVTEGQVEVARLQGVISGRDRECLALRDEISELREKLDARREERLAKSREKTLLAMRQQILTLPATFELCDRYDWQALLISDSSSEDDLICLGIPGDREGQGYRATPAFRTLDDLEAFCRERGPEYEVLDIDGAGPPATWFWERK